MWEKLATVVVTLFILLVLAGIVTCVWMHPWLLMGN